MSCDGQSLRSPAQICGRRAGVRQLTYSWLVPIDNSILYSSKQARRPKNYTTHPVEQLCMPEQLRVYIAFRPAAK